MRVVRGGKDDGEGRDEGWHAYKKSLVHSSQELKHALQSKLQLAPHQQNQLLVQSLLVQSLLVQSYWSNHYWSIVTVHALKIIITLTPLIHEGKGLACTMCQHAYLYNVPACKPVQCASMHTCTMYQHANLYNVPACIPVQCASMHTCTMLDH